MKAVLALVAKDLRTEARAKEVAPAMVVFGVILVFLFTLAFPPGAGRAPVPLPQAGAVASREIAGIFLWVAILFAAIVGIGRNAAIEKEGGRIEGLLMAPVDPAGIFAGKALSNFAYLWVMEAAMLPVFILFFDVSPGLLLPRILLVLLIVNVGLAATGTLFAAASQYSRVREVVLPLLAFPILLPATLAGARLTSSLLLSGHFSGEAGWFILMAAFDLSICAIGAVTFEYVIRE